MNINCSEFVELLKDLIRIPSFSGEEDQTATLLMDFLTKKSVCCYRKHNNVWAYHAWYDPQKPTILLNSHHDTVKPALGYTRSPFDPCIEDGKLYGLGSNDAGASLIGLIATFLYFSDNPSFPYNFVLACTAEEEISGKNGIACILNDLPLIDFAIVGEPTEMHLAVAEKGLIVLDCYAYGKAGHAARNEGENAIYKAIADIEWFRTYQFERVSEMLGSVKMTVTQIEAGKQHNVVPDVCHFVVDVRTTDAYTNEETLDIIRASVRSEVKPRSLRLQPSSIPLSHPFVRAGVKFGRRCFGSPTLSDQALLPYPSVKIGIGDSARSHTANEFVRIREIEDGIALYIALLEEVGRMV